MEIKRRLRLLVLRIAIVTVLVGLQIGHATPSSDPSSPSLQPLPARASRSAVLPVAHQGFTLAASLTTIRSGGSPQLRSSLQRFQRADGVYKLIQIFYAADASQQGQTHFGFVGLGVFGVDHERHRLVFTAPQIEEPVADIEQFLRRNPLFAREESVAGLHTIVWRKRGRTEEQFVEEYRAPSLDGLLIKRVKQSAGQREVFEATAIQMGEPGPALFTELMLYRPDYSSYLRQIHKKEKENDHESGRLMRELMERMRRVKP